MDVQSMLGPFGPPFGVCGNSFFTNACAIEFLFHFCWILGSYMGLNGVSRLRTLRLSALAFNDIWNRNRGFCVGMVEFSGFPGYLLCWENWLSVTSLVNLVDSLTDEAGFAGGFPAGRSRSSSKSGTAEGFPTEGGKSSRQTEVLTTRPACRRHGGGYMYRSLYIACMSTCTSIQYVPFNPSVFKKECNTLEH